MQTRFEKMIGVSQPMQKVYQQIRQAAETEIAVLLTGSRDLFYRLDVFRIDMPPLRARQVDIPLLVNAFIGNFNHLFQKHICAMNAETLGLLEDYDWPGNVRELKNVVQRAMLVCENEEILPEHLPPRFRPEPNPTTPRHAVTIEVGTPLKEVERQMIFHALKVADFSRKQAAKLLGISRRAIYNKLRKHNIQLDELNDICR